MSRPAPAFRLPPWLAHALRAQRAPVSWSAVTRGALSAGPLLLTAVLLDRTALGVIAAIAAMLAGINDRPGSRRAAVKRLGLPALAGAAGLLVGTYAGVHADPVVLTLLFTGIGLLAGGVSAVGPVASGAGTQLLVASAVGAGMPAPEAGWARALAFVAGAGWLLGLRLLLPTPGATAGDFRFDGERVAVAAVYDAVADLLDAAGTEAAVARRVALTAALDHAQDALAGPRLRRYASSSAERRLHAQYAAALPLAEAATALAWAGEPVTGRTSEGPRRLAAAVRENTHTGPLPAPHRSVPALRALDDALLHAADAFDRGSGGDLHTRNRSVRDLLRVAFGAGGREYGLRVALCFGASAAVAQALHHARWYGQHTHWYWLPATAVFLVKPDLGPLASRVLSRAAGTVLGALLFAGFAAVLPRPEGLVVLVTLCGALIPVSTRHFAAQTTVVTVLVLALVHRVQHGQHARRRDQRDQGAHHARGVRDHPARRSGAVLGGVEQFVEGVVLDRRQLHGGRPLQVQLGGHPLHLGLQAPGRPGGRGPQQRPDQGHSAQDRQHRHGAAQPVLDRAPGDQPPQHAVHGQQADRLRHTPAHLGRDHRARRPPVGLPGQPAARPQQLRQPCHHGPQAQLQERVVVRVPAHVVTQRPAEQQPLRLGHPGLAGTGPLPAPHPPRPP